MNKIGEHQDSKGQEMQAFESVGQAFIIAGQSTKTRHPTKRPLNDPATRQEDESVLGIRQLDDDQANAVFGGGLFGLVSGIALVNKDDFDVLVRHALDLLRQLTNLGTVLKETGSTAEAEPLLRRALAIFVKTAGPDSPEAKYVRERLP